MIQTVWQAISSTDIAGLQKRHSEETETRRLVGSTTPGSTMLATSCVWLIIPWVCGCSMRWRRGLILLGVAIAEPVGRAQELAAALGLDLDTPFLRGNSIVAAQQKASAPVRGTGN
jgi:hypothetical protein